MSGGLQRSPRTISVVAGTIGELAATSASGYLAWGVVFLLFAGFFLRFGPRWGVAVAERFFEPEKAVRFAKWRSRLLASLALIVGVVFVILGLTKLA